MRRHHYLYVRNRYLTDPAVLKRIAALHRATSCEQARELGLVDPEGAGSFTHPHLSRMLYADGKVITPLFKGRLGETRTDKATGEIKQVRYEPDADLHFEGDGELAYGTKFVVVAARSGKTRGRIILDVDWVPDKGGEAKAAMGCFERLSPLVPGGAGRHLRHRAQRHPPPDASSQPRPASCQQGHGQEEGLHEAAPGRGPAGREERPRRGQKGQALGRNR